MSRLLEALKLEVLKKEVKAQAKTKGRATEAKGSWEDSYCDQHSDGSTHTDNVWGDYGESHYPNK